MKKLTLLLITVATCATSSMHATKIDDKKNIKQLEADYKNCILYHMKKGAKTGSLGYAGGKALHQVSTPSELRQYNRPTLNESSTYYLPNRLNSLTKIILAEFAEQFVPKDVSTEAEFYENNCGSILPSVTYYTTALVTSEALTFFSSKLP